MDPGGMDPQNGSLPTESGITEGNIPTEKKSYLKSIKRCARNISITKQPAESSEYISDCYFSGPEWVPEALPRDINRGNSVLESKVKALKEKRNAINTQAQAVSHERTSPKKAKAQKGKPLPEAAPQDAVVERQAQIRTYLTDVLLDSTDYPHCKQEESQGTLFTSLCPHDFQPLERPKSAEEASGPGWHSPKQSWRLTGKRFLDKKWSPVNTRKKETPNGPSSASSLKDLSFTQKYFEETNGREENIFQERELERQSFIHRDDPCGLVTAAGRLWKAESWDSLASVGSNASVLSLAERVERNRFILQEMLRVSQLNSHPSRELHTARHHKKEAPTVGNDGSEILSNDIDWDSGVSLQDSEGYRAFVPNQELELSPRHEQAKQLLQRARMKARTNPLRASHNILTTFSQERRDASRMPAADAKNFFAKGEDSHTSGNLSDSSSGESGCDQQRKRGPSPSRVRFEDESARDAEVRYMERLQQRQKRVLDSVLLSLGQGALVSKPDLSDYINGSLQRKPNSTTNPGWKQQSTGQATGALAYSSGREKEKPLLVNAEGKCSACGSYVSNLMLNSISDVRENQTGKGVDQTANVSQESKDSAQRNENSTPQEDSRTRTLGPKGTPLWILPSRQRVYTERIRETYIGEVTCIDDVDSALDSATDTSDSYRTDSEEAGASNQPSVAPNHWHGGAGSDHSPLCALEKENRKVEAEKPKANANCRTNAEACNSVLSPSKVENKSTGNETINPNSKRTSEIKSEVTKVSASKAAEGFPRGNQPVEQQQLGKKGRSQGQVKVFKAQLRQPTTTVHFQPSHLIPDSAKDSVSRQPGETSVHTHKVTNNLSEAKLARGASQQLTKEIAASYNTVYRVPVPPSSGKGHSSPMPYRRAVLTGSSKLTDQNAEQIEQDSNLPMFSASTNNFHHVQVSGVEEQSTLQNPKMLSKAQLLALSTNNCNNKNAKLQPKLSATAATKSAEEHLQDSQKLRKKQGPSSSACDVPSLTSNAISPAAISLSVTAEEASSTTSPQSGGKNVPVAELQKTKTKQASAVQCKPLSAYPEPKKKQFAKKGGTSSSSSSSSGLKKFFLSLSQSTKQKLGRFRCYSMEQICDPDPGAAMSTEEQSPSTTSSPKMKKAPSLQSLQLGSPFCRPRKASSVQNLHFLLGKTDRSSAYMLGEPKDAEVFPSRKAGAQPQRSLSVEDIGSPNLVRNVGRVVEVFPDGTSQLELQRTPQGNFGFRVSSGNGRPDTGIYIQEMADASTAKLYTGLLGVGDEILEVNGAKVAGLGLAQINELLLWADTLSVRVLRQRPTRR